MPPTKPKLLMSGSLGIRKDVLGDDHIDWLKCRMTLESPGFKDQPPTIAYAYRECEDYIWAPRYFNHLDWWPKIKHWQWVAPPLNYDLQSNFIADPKRKQPEAIEALVSQIREHSGTIGVLPTGIGKTFVSLEVARHFNTPIGVLVYAGHQIDNWREHAVKHLGIPEKDIGLIKEGKCSIGRPFTIISIQTVLSRDLPQAALDQFGFIIADECVTGDSLITTDVGEVRIDSIPESSATSVLCYDEHGEQWTFRKIKRWIPQGKKQTITVSVSNGSKLRLTTNHPVMTERGWVNAGDLKLGDKIQSPAAAAAATSYQRKTRKVDHAASLGGIEREHQLIGTSESKTLTTQHLTVNVDVERDLKSGTTSLPNESEPTDGLNLRRATTTASRRGFQSTPRSSRWFTEHYSETRTSSRTLDPVQILGSHLIIQRGNASGRNSRLEGCPNLASSYEKSRTQDLVFDCADVPVSAIQIYQKFLASLGRQNQSVAIGLNASQMRDGRGGTWTMDPAQGVESDSTQRDLTRNPSEYSQISSQSVGTSILLSNGLSANTSASGCAFPTQSNGSDLSNHLQHQEWTTNFLTITKIEDGPICGEDVYDLEIEEHHNFVANGLLVHNCHRFGAAKWGKVVAKFPARYRLAMSADPVRDDGLDPIIRWNFGKIGYALHTRPTGELPLVCLIRYPVEYSERKYLDWKKIRGKWVPGTPNFQKYCKLLAKDKARNEWLVDKIIDARAKGRAILVFTHHRTHLKHLHDRFVSRWNLAHAQAGTENRTTTGILWGGLKEKERNAAQQADVIFTTHGFAREALNITHLDTLIFGTPPGNPLQPAGRLRDKGPTTRKSLLILDPFENGNYPFKKAMKRKLAYEDLGMTVKRLAAKNR